MKYYYWLQYGFHVYRLFPCSKQEYDKNRSVFKVYPNPHDGRRTYPSYYFGDKLITRNATYPRLTYCSDTYFYGYFKSSKIDDDGNLQGDPCDVIDSDDRWPDPRT